MYEYNVMANETEEENDNDASDGFEEADSICSLTSEHESVVNNWRGWRKGSNANSAQKCRKTSHVANHGGSSKDVLSLVELSTQTVAAHIPFEVVENFPFVHVDSAMPQPVPEQLQLRIAFWAFPDNEEDIRLYSCLANGSGDEFAKGEHLFRIKCVHEPLQIGFHLSARIASPSSSSSSLPGSEQSTSVTFDRKKIVSSQCSCSSNADWCAHVVALCLHRIHLPQSVKLRAPVSESLFRLERDQLRKFAQELIARLPEQILPVAQNILDDLLSHDVNDIQERQGVPDPTAGGAAGEQASWCLDGRNLRENIKKILVKFCVPAPIVFSDVNYLSTTAPPSASEWCSFLRPLRGREPEGMWNLLCIVREMYRRNDRNGIPLLEIITQQCLDTAQIMVWWFNAKVAQLRRGHVPHNSSGGGNGKHGGGGHVNANTQASQNACSSLCEEIVTLWKLAALNPCISPQERETLRHRLTEYHLAVIDKIQANQQVSSKSQRSGNQSGAQSNHQGRIWSDLELFSGFKPAIEACLLDWSDCPIPGITYGQSSRLAPFAVFTLKNEEEQFLIHSQVNSSQAVLNCEYPSALPKERDDIDEGVVNDPMLFEDMTNDEGSNSANNSDTDNNSGNDVGAANKNDDEGNNGSNNDLPAAAAMDDQYKVYFYDNQGSKRNKADDGSNANSTGNGDSSRLDVFANLRLKLDDPWEVLFMRAEGIHAHGYHKEASNMAVHLANKLLSQPPDLMDQYTKLQQQAIANSHGRNGRHRRRQLLCFHPVTHLASSTLAQCAFLCSVLTETNNHNNLAFRVALLGLELARPPASTKPMEVKLAHQESELVLLLKKIPIGESEMTMIRDRALRLHEDRLRPRGESVLPLMLASYVFECLLLHSKEPEDEKIAFEAAVAAIGLKAQVCEADHPLLCEGSRRQRGDLALMLLTNYKNYPHRLARVMDKLLDREMQPNFKAAISPSYYDNGTNSHQNDQRHLGASANVAEASASGESSGNNESSTRRSSYDAWDYVLRGQEGQQRGVDHQNGSRDAGPSLRESQSSHSLRTFNVGPGSESGSSGCNSSVAGDSANSLTSNGNSRGHRAGNPLMDRRQPHLGANNIPVGIDNNNGLAGNPLPFAIAPGIPFNKNGGAIRKSMSCTKMELTSRGIKGHRFKNSKRGSYPLVPNQPSEASAHFMFELAKMVLNRAGGNSSTSLFTQTSARGPHRALHMCAFQIGLYALGLHNRVSPNWLSRTYSSHVSWITGQALELGSGAIQFLMSTWTDHLTPAEAANLADKASKTRQDTSMNRAGAELALSVLPLASALNPNEVQRAIQQCKETSSIMLEKACLAVEKAANSGGVYPEVLFQVARHWFSLYLETSESSNNNSVNSSNNNGSNQENQNVPAPMPPNQAASQQQIFQQQPPPQMLMNANNLAQQLNLAHQNFQVPGYPFPAVYSFFQPPSLASSVSTSTATSAPLMYLTPPPTQSPQAMAAAAAAAALQQLQLAAQQQQQQQPGQPILRAPPPNTAAINPRLGFPNPSFYPLVSSLLPPPTPPPTAAMANPLAASFMAPAPAPPAAAIATPPPAAMAQPPPSAPPSGNRQGGRHRRLVAAYRVGMLALDGLGRKINEDRPQTRFTKNPTYGEDVKWLLSIANKLGVSYVDKFLMHVVSNIRSPFLLQELVWESASIYASLVCGVPIGSVQYSNVVHHIRTQLQLQPIISTCFQMYYACLHQRLGHLTPADYDDFVSVLLHARQAFLWTGDGHSTFNQLLQTIKKSKNCKQELRQKITSQCNNNSNASSDLGPPSQQQRSA